MSKPLDRRRRGGARSDHRARPKLARVPVAAADRRLRHPESLHDRLARLLEAPHLGRLVPHLAPETLHQLIRHRGVDASAEVLASVTPGQLAFLLDLDLWRSTARGVDEQFDYERFVEWVEALVETGDASAARIVARIDVHLVVAGLSRYIRVLDPAARARASSDDGRAAEDDAMPSSGLACDVGGYVVLARRTEAWDAIVSLLLALDAEHPDYFHAVMQGCRQLSSAGREVDGLDELLAEPEQLLHDIGRMRERRRSEQGYLTRADGRAFLEMARRAQNNRASASSTNPVAAAYLRAAAEAAAPVDGDGRAHDGGVASRSSRVTRAIDAIADLLGEASPVPGRPRALLEGRVDRSSPLAHMQRLIERVRDTDGAAHQARSRELAFLANALMAGCSLQSRPFSAGEAADAAAAVCNLGLEHWPARWPEAEREEWSSTEGGDTPLPDAFLVDHDLVRAFEVGWAVLHDVTMLVAGRLIAILKDLRCDDVEIQEGLERLRRELARQLDAGTPWRAREALDAIAVLDMPAWAALLGLLDECPVLPDALTATLEGRTRAVSATAFEFISTRRQIDQVRAFMAQLLDILLR